MKNHVLMLCLTATIALGGTFVSAQDNRPKTSVERRNERLANTYLSQLKDLRSTANYRLQSRLADIDRAVELSEAQERKLKIAAKGAVQNFMEKENERLIAQARKIGFELDLTAEIDQGVQMTVSYSRSRNVVAQDVEKEKIWQNSIENVLTEEQNQTLTAWLEERNAFRMNTALDLFIARVDTLLLLSPEQRVELREVVGARYGKQLWQKLEKQMNRNGISSNRRSKVQEFDVEWVSEILTESQLEQWRQSFAPEIKRMDDDKAKAQAAEKGRPGRAIEVPGRPRRVIEVPR